MMILSRRHFLGSSLSAGLFARTARADRQTGPRLVVVMLRGAVDGLNVVAPYGDPAYRAARPTLALGRPGAADGVIDLDGHFGLHPALAALKPLWDARRLGFIHASGSPDPTRSHFDAQNYMETGTPGQATTPSGWLNRVIGALPPPHGPTQAISLGLVAPRMLAGPWPASNLFLGPNANRPMAVDRPEIARAFARLYDGRDGMSQAFRQGQAARQELIKDMDQAPAADQGAPNANGFPAMAPRLARLLLRDPKIRLAFVDLGGWDTHVRQGNARGQLADRLRPLGDGLAAFAAALGPELDRTVVLVMSEFGRTVQENGDGGTDHGHGNVLWVLGGSVAGGLIHGSWPGLAAAALHEGRDLAVTTDFRAVIAVVLERHLGLSDRALGTVLPQAPLVEPGLRRLIPV